MRASGHRSAPSASGISLLTSGRASHSAPSAIGSVGASHPVAHVTPWKESGRLDWVSTALSRGRAHSVARDRRKRCRGRRASTHPGDSPQRSLDPPGGRGGLQWPRRGGSHLAQCIEQRQRADSRTRHSGCLDQLLELFEGGPISGSTIVLASAAWRLSPRPSDEKEGVAIHLNHDGVAARRRLDPMPSHTRFSGLLRDECGRRRPGVQKPVRSAFLG